MGRKKRNFGEGSCCFTPFCLDNDEDSGLKHLKLRLLETTCFFCLAGIELMEVLTNYDTNSRPRWKEPVLLVKLMLTALNAYQIPVGTPGTDLICCDVSFED